MRKENTKNVTCDIDRKPFDINPRIFFFDLSPKIKEIKAKINK